MRLFYSVLLYALLPGLCCYLGWRSLKDSSYQKGWRERLGFGRYQRADVLIHTVSMGETQAALPLIQNLRATYPHLKLCLSCSSPTAYALLTDKFQGEAQITYLPFDFVHGVKRFVAEIQPKVAFILESEIWPNLIAELKAQQAHLVLGNARMSAQTHAAYQKAKRLMAPAFSSLDQCLVQTQTEAQRFCDMGVAKDKVRVSGSLKFDLNIDLEHREQATHWQGLWQGRPVWVAGSVHPKELPVILASHQQLLQHMPDALLVLVARHPENFVPFAKAVAQAKINCVRWSEQPTCFAEQQVFLVDTMGALLGCFGAADVAFVGGSLNAHGGHNPIEAAVFGVPVLMGPSTFNFAEICHLLEQSQHLSLVDSCEALTLKLMHYMMHPAQRDADGQAGKAVVAQHAGAQKMHMLALQSTLAQLGLVASE